jgi:hypothetical protein
VREKERRRKSDCFYNSNPTHSQSNVRYSLTEKVAAEIHLRLERLFGDIGCLHTAHDDGQPLVLGHVIENSITCVYGFPAGERNTQHLSMSGDDSMTRSLALLEVDTQLFVDKLFIPQNLVGVIALSASFRHFLIEQILKDRQ